MILPADKKEMIKSAVYQNITKMQDILHSETDGVWPIADEWAKKYKNTATIIAVGVSN